MPRALLMVIGALLLVPLPARAFSCGNAMPPHVLAVESPNDAREQYAAIVVGRVLRIGKPSVQRDEKLVEVDEVIGDEQPFTPIRVKVEAVFQGEVGSEIVVRQGVAAFQNGLTYISGDEFRYSKGERYVIPLTGPIQGIYGTCVRPEVISRADAARLAAKAGRTFAPSGSARGASFWGMVGVLAFCVMLAASFIQARLRRARSVRMPAI